MAHETIKFINIWLSGRGVLKAFRAFSPRLVSDSSAMYKQKADIAKLYNCLLPEPDVLKTKQQITSFLYPLKQSLLSVSTGFYFILHCHTFI